MLAVTFCAACVVWCTGKFLDVLQSTLECHQDEAVMQLAAAVVGHLLQSHTRDVLPGFFADQLCACVGRLLANTKSNNLTASLLSESETHAHRAQLQVATANVSMLYAKGSLTSFGLTASCAVCLSLWLLCATCRHSAVSL